MFDFDLELKKFKPAVGVDVGETLLDEDVKDITDLVDELIKEKENRKNKEA